jgi:endonuclease-8
MAIAAALLDQRAVAGIGNIWRNETLFHECIDPWAPVEELDDPTLRRLVATARDLLRRSVETPSGRTPMWVYRRAGRPCRRCGSLVSSEPPDTRIQRTTYWCPACQGGKGLADGRRRRPV